MLVGWWFHSVVHGRGAQTNSAYSFYNDLLGPIGLNGPGKTEIALTNPHVLLYLGLNSPGPALGVSPKDIPVPADMAAVLNKSANDNQADFPYHHFFVDSDATTRASVRPRRRSAWPAHLKRPAAMQNSPKSASLTGRQPGRNRS